MVGAWSAHGRRMVGGHSRVSLGSKVHAGFDGRPRFTLWILFALNSLRMAPVSCAFVSPGLHVHRRIDSARSWFH